MAFDVKPWAPPPASAALRAAGLPPDLFLADEPGPCLLGDFVTGLQKGTPCTAKMLLRSVAEADTVQSVHGGWLVDCMN